MLESAVSPHLEPIAHGGTLPDLPSTRINMYRAQNAKGALVEALEDMVRTAYGRMAVAA
jgi:hypothetical protein